MKKDNAGYTVVDLSRWKRKEHFEVFQSIAQCTFSQTVQLDITNLLKYTKDQNWKFYPSMIHLIAGLLNKHSEFRMAIKDDSLVTWDVIHPSYTIFHEKTETFSSLWCHYDDDIHHFLKKFSDNAALYSDCQSYFPKGEFIENIFFISANPWLSFTSFDFTMSNINNFFAPMFTIGKYYVQDQRVLMPLAIQVHHAVCDGFHVGRLVNELQNICNSY